MNKRQLSFTVIGVALFAASLFGAWQLGKQQAMQVRAESKPPAAAAHAEGSADAAGKKVLYWYDPMFPTQRFDKPGKSPFMDMMLVPKYADEGTGASGVSIDPRLAQRLGMRVATVTRERLAPSLEAVASVMFNERDVAIVQARQGGFVQRVYRRAPGDVISAGAGLVDLLVPEWLGAQQEWLALQQAGDKHLADAARQRLIALGMTEREIEAVARSGQAHGTITISAPIAGVIQELGVREGMTLTSGAMIARINGVATVWLEAAVPEAQAAMLAPGRTVQARFAAYPGEAFDGRIAAILPEANRETRTLRVRMEFANRDRKLHPGMYAQVALAGAAEDALVVPAEAVIRTGKRAIVYLAAPDKPGRYTPAEIELGREINGKLVVRKGLTEGQQVVSSGQFLIDSEASLAGALARDAMEQSK